MYKLTLWIFAVFLSVAYTTLNKLFAVFFMYYTNNVDLICSSQLFHIANANQSCVNYFVSI